MYQQEQGWILSHTILCTMMISQRLLNISPCWEKIMDILSPVTCSLHRAEHRESFDEWWGTLAMVNGVWGVLMDFTLTFALLLSFWTHPSRSWVERRGGHWKKNQDFEKWNILKVAWASILLHCTFLVSMIHDIWSHWTLNEYWDFKNVHSIHNFV